VSRLRTFLSRPFGWLGGRKRESDPRRDIDAHVADMPGHLLHRTVVDHDSADGLLSAGATRDQGHSGRDAQVRVGVTS
jgi:hypothetical protein